ncbi:hypothetical protein [Cellulomonas sp. HD19AZ1]|uniref:hypothetical protein n=1 Tax=Cellulomonas sp. HD19AZ1 TaxID=2559593 RepID=UPI001070FB6F|nr:hypothetical protein [Cellulomonas sp. HD19AZ1]TFH68147.1 hypothetical protein E4A51_18045 [Cellulomonas sp. HD19AZ1]
MNDVEADLRLLTFGVPGFDRAANDARVAFLEEQLALPPDERHLPVPGSLEVPAEVQAAALEVVAREVVAHGGDVERVAHALYPDAPEEVEAAAAQVESAWEREAHAVSASGAVVAALEAGRGPDDPDDVTRGIASATADWEQRAQFVAARAHVGAPTSDAAARARRLSEQSGALLERVRDLHGEQDEVAIADDALERTHLNLAARVESIQGQVADLAYTIDPPPTPGASLHH